MLIFYLFVTVLREVQQNYVNHNHFGVSDSARRCS